MKLVMWAGLALALSACGGSSDATAPTATVPGTYALATINGGALPYTYNNGNGNYDVVLRGAVVLGADGSFTLAEAHYYGPGVPGTLPTTDTMTTRGTYTVAGTQIVAAVSIFTSDGQTYSPVGAADTLAISGKQLITGRPGSPYVYVKQ